ncbi:hypothetical protein PPYR_14820 [Photinus pyralis]|uniref:NIF3-like protein 1 n=1 Tax=Photinus pyralis TaxID=7054 RepID=A0A5N4A6C6_PHOPY|nr:NIF3-like protein 1 isoform X2 [Photinus pyralis]KAB0792861.1 hypothetical protein PPYR_14820 [Photinus pyralis]
MLPRVLLRHLAAVRYSNYSNTMAKTDGSGRLLEDIILKLGNFAPLTLAESWDNVGLLVDPMESQKIKRILLTNDLTEDVVEEAINLNAGLIISYHPNIFQPLKRVTATSWKERIIVQCIKHKIAVYSPHTSWDSVRGGVNDWLAQAFDVNEKTPVNQDPANPECGSGRLCSLSKPIPVEELVDAIKSHIGIPHLRLALGKQKTQKDTVSSVALCAGSGSSVLKGVRADLYLTGEMLHHDVLDATQNGIHVILCNHSDSERGFLRHFQNILHKTLLNGDVGVFVSQVDRDPLVTV